MLGWLRHKTTPNPDAEERLGKLLGRLGNESHTTATAVEVALREVVSEPVVSESAGEPAAEPSGASPGAATQPTREYVSGVDPEDYREAVPLLRRAMAAVGGKPEDDSAMLAAKIVSALRERHGFTPDLLSDINPYLEQFVRDIRAGVIQLDIEDAPPTAAAPPERTPIAEAPETAEPPVAETAEPPVAETAAVVEPEAQIQPPPAAESITPDAPAAEEEVPEIASRPVPRRRGKTKSSGDAEMAGEAPSGAPPMRVIAVCSQKGGAGKTTIAAHLAVRAGETGHGPAVLIDTDPQGSLGEWWRARHADSPALAKVTLEDLPANLAELRSYGTAIAIIDTPPALTGSIEQVIAVADLVVIPARPSPHDLRAVGATVEMARRAGKPFLFVVNGAAPRASITAQAVAALSEHGRVVPVILYQRTDFAASMIDGRTVTETAAAGSSAQEVARLWDYVYEQISIRAAA